MADSRDILINLLGKETVSTAADKAGKATERLGDKLDDTADDAARLDREIKQAERGLQELAVAFARTGDAAERIDITKKMRQQQSELRKLTRAKDLLPDFGGEGEKAATGFAASFVTRVGPLLARAPMGGPGAAIGAGLAAFFVPILSAAAAGAVLGGIGAGGIVGGIKLASKDARVQSAAKELADTVTRDLDRSGAHFVGPTIQSIGIIRAAWNDVADDVDGTLEASARNLVPVAEGVADAVREVTPSIRRAAEAAGPIFREIREGLPRLGAALGDVLDDFADDADEGASAVRYLFMAVEEGIGFVGGAVHVFAQMYRAVLDVADAAVTAEEALLGWNPLFKGTIAEGRAKVDELKGALDKGGQAGADAGTKIEGGLRKVDSAAGDAVVEVETLNESLRRLVDQNISTEEANIRLEEAIDRAAEAAKRNGDGIDTNIPKQRENHKALVDLATATNDVYQKTLEQTGSHELAAQAAERGRKKFLETADSMNVEKDKAIELANKLIAIPNVNRTVTITANTQPAIDSAKSIVARINAMHARISVSARGTTSFGGSAHTGEGYSTGYSSGGPVRGPGVKGVDSVPAVLAPGEHVLTAAEVDAAGGHAGIERIRSALRSGRTSASAGAAGSVGGVAGGGVLTVNAVLTSEMFAGDDIMAAIVRGLRVRIKNNGGSVQRYLGRED